MNLTTILDFFRLTSAPWFSLVVSLLALFAAAAFGFGIPVTAAVGEFLLMLGLPGGVIEATRDVHEWMVDPRRSEWGRGSAFALAMMSCLFYLRAMREMNEFRRQSVMGPPPIGSVVARPFGQGNATEAERAEAEATAWRERENQHKKFVEAGRRSSIFFRASQARCITLFWFSVVVAVEVGGWLPQALGALATFLVAGILVVSVRDEFPREHDSPRLAEVARNTLDALGNEIVNVINATIGVFVALPLFILGNLLYPSPPSTHATTAG